ncbi:hypothetical protein Adt_22820 [Abeliophyllum distichum]|uniref:Uncharacterized protein n=1 Tax=Abeliophyllum distichum TaxID=126358 RepID=A0ABD1S9B0_9LAMI
MSSRSDDSQNQSEVRTNPSIRGESPSSPSSSEAIGKGNQAPSASCPSTPSTSGKRACPTVPSKNVVDRKGLDIGIPKMRGSLGLTSLPLGLGEVTSSRLG